MLKPIVRYTNLAVEPEIGQSAFLTPIDHTSLRVTNGRIVRTSPVVQYDEATGNIETLNTIYKPKE